MSVITTYLLSTHKYALHSTPLYTCHSPTVRSYLQANEIILEQREYIKSVREGRLVMTKVPALAGPQLARLGRAPARPLCLLSARLAALGSLALPERGPATGRPATASGARARRLQSRRSRRSRLWLIQVKDLQGYAFGSAAGNAGKVIAQDFTVFAATAAWVVEAHRLQELSKRTTSAVGSAPFDVGPIGVMAEVDVFNMTLRLCRDALEKKQWLSLAVGRQSF